MTQVRGWAPLQEGDVVDVIAPGMRPKPESVKAARALLQDWGLVARIPHPLTGSDPVSSNSDEKRFAHLQQALLAKDSSVIWCLRGGYGSIRLLPFLSRMKRPQSPKLLVGLSDITSLHVFMGQKWNWATLHGPHLDRMATGGNPPSVMREVKQILFGEKDVVAFKALKPMNALARGSGNLRARVTGGNSVTVQSTIGTPFQIETKGRILFLEDLGERGYRVDRILEHLNQAGLIKGLKAVVFGTFTGGAEPDGRKLWRPVLQRFADQAPCPVFKGIPSGHDPVQRPLPFHTLSELNWSHGHGELVCPTQSR